MPYRYKTKFYRIPVMGEGDILTEEQEWVQMSTIDNLLYAANFGCTKAFIEEGEYSLRWNEGHSECRLIIKPPKPDGFSLMGIINGRLFYSNSELNVGVFYPEMKYYVYVEYDTNLETDTEGFMLLAYTERQVEGNLRMHLCDVDTYNGTIKTDVNKVYAKNILAHTMDTTNPHGETQVQDNLVVNKSLVVSGVEVKGSMYVLVLSAGNGGYVDVPVGEGKKPLFAQAVPQTLGAGEIACGIYPDKVRVFNSGSTGIPINVKVDLQ